ncbi:hypothetical protein [Achromobacter insolitus]|uniref:hypothetical protein n=1 Tax=Achromobacter insolitus TaxID=217204 RepID=UPI000537A74A|nr:hypothetical protein [Achromobacter insolitus]AVG38342.1 hypothetical protein MC81_02545 [Achromobacter insolitus]
MSDITSKLLLAMTLVKSGEPIMIQLTEEQGIALRGPILEYSHERGDSSLEAAAEVISAALGRTVIFSAR